MDVSICLPVYNEKLALRKTVLEIKEVFEKLPYKYEIIIIDDGSTDNCVDEIQDIDVRIITHKRHLGGGIARVTGMRYAKGSVIFQSDADQSYPCDQVPEIMERMKHADMVIAARKRESASDFHLLRVFMKWMLKTLGSILTGQKIPDLNSGMRAYDRKLALRYSHLYPKSHSIMTTMTLAFLTENLRVDFVKIDYRKRVGKSSYRPIQDTYNFLVTIIRTIAYFDPIRILMPISLSIASIAIFFTYRDITLFLRINSVTTITWILSVLIIVLAILSDQFARLSRQLAFHKGHYWEDLDGKTIEEKKINN